MKVLVVIDVQNDFVTGSLGSPEAVAAIPSIKEKISSFLHLNTTRRAIAQSRQDVQDAQSKQGEHKEDTALCDKNEQPAACAQSKQGEQCECDKEDAAGEKRVVVFTQDTHEQTYLETQEGKNLPVEHCVKGTSGWEIVDDVRAMAPTAHVFEKPTFGSEELVAYLKDLNKEEAITAIELIGFCTDICVISNTLLLKAALPEVPLIVDETCCAGVTPETHEAALQVLRSCQVQV